MSKGNNVVLYQNQEHDTRKGKDEKVKGISARGLLKTLTI